MERMMEEGAIKDDKLQVQLWRVKDCPRKKDKERLLKFCEATRKKNVSTSSAVTFLIKGSYH